MIKRSVIITLTACFISLLAHAQSACDLVVRGASLKGVTVPLYTRSPQKELSALIHVDRTYIDYERRAFFRIGVLPVEVLDGVRFEVNNCAGVSNVLARLAEWSTPQLAKRLELRNVKIRIGDTSLESQRVRFLSSGKWELLDGVVFVSGTNAIYSPTGKFETTGKHAGEVVLQSTPPSTNSFLVQHY